MSMPAFTAALTQEDRDILARQDARVAADLIPWNTLYMMQVDERNHAWLTRHVTSWRAHVRQPIEWADQREQSPHVEKSKRRRR